MNKCPKCNKSDEVVTRPDGTKHCLDCGESVASGPSDATAGSSVGGEFYQGIEWLACWLLDNVEGETIAEEQLRPWAQKAWFAHLDRKNA
jgi:hypothetical protein